VLFYGCVAGEVSKNRLLGIHAWKEQLLSKEQWNNNVTNSKPSVVRSSMATFECTCSEHTLLTVMGRSVPALHYQDKVSRRLLKLCRNGDRFRIQSQMTRGVGTLVGKLRNASQCLLELGALKKRPRSC
jgi:hypothetical protein